MEPTVPTDLKKDLAKVLVELGSVLRPSQDDTLHQNLVRAPPRVRELAELLEFIARPSLGARAASPMDASLLPGASQAVVSPLPVPATPPSRTLPIRSLSPPALPRSRVREAVACVSTDYRTCLFEIELAWKPLLQRPEPFVQDLVGRFGCVRRVPVRVVPVLDVLPDVRWFRHRNDLCLGEIYLIWEDDELDAIAASFGEKFGDFSSCSSSACSSSGSAAG